MLQVHSSLHVFSRGKRTAIKPFYFHFFCTKGKTVIRKDVYVLMCVYVCVHVGGCKLLLDTWKGLQEKIERDIHICINERRKTHNVTWIVTISVQQKQQYLETRFSSFVTPCQDNEKLVEAHMMMQLTQFHNTNGNLLSHRSCCYSRPIRLLFIYFFGVIQAHFAFDASKGFVGSIACVPPFLRRKHRCHWFKATYLSVFFSFMFFFVVFCCLFSLLVILTWKQSYAFDFSKIKKSM